MPLDWMGAPPLQGPSFLGMLGMEGILHCQFLSGSGRDRSFRGGGPFYGPSYYMTPWPQALLGTSAPAAGCIVAPAGTLGEAAGHPWGQHRCFWCPQLSVSLALG